MLGYIISNVLVLICIDSVLQMSNQILGRVLAGAILLAFFGLWIYDSDVNVGMPGFFGTNVGYADIISLVFLLVGMEFYGGDPEPDVQIITNQYSSPVALSATSYNTSVSTSNNNTNNNNRNISVNSRGGEAVYQRL